MGVIVDRCASDEVFESLKKLNIRYIKSADLSNLYKPVNTHPDMQIHFIDEKTAVSAPSVFEYYKARLPLSIKLYKGANDPGSTYPFDCAYNVAKLGKRIVGNFSYTDAVIKELYQQSGYEFINTKQGYTKCSLCIVDKNSVITEDQGLSETLINNGINVLKIQPGEVGLNNFEYGFIGGASGEISPRKLAFFGDISKTVYSDKVISFIKDRDVDIIYLSQTKLHDYGSLLYFED